MEDEAIKLSEDQKELIEEAGVFMEKQGMQPAPARVIALLLVSEEPELSFDQIKDTLQLSKSAVSNAINTLLDKGTIDYITKTGDRKRYFRDRVVNWKEDVIKGFDTVKHQSDLFKRILKQRPGDTVQFNNKLKEVIDFMDFLGARLPELFQEWEEKRKKE